MIFHLLSSSLPGKTLESSSEADFCLRKSLDLGWHFAASPWQSGCTFIRQSLHFNPWRVCPGYKKNKQLDFCKNCLFVIWRKNRNFCVKLHNNAAITFFLAKKYVKQSLLGYKLFSTLWFSVLFSASFSFAFTIINSFLQNIIFHFVTLFSFASILEVKLCFS